MRSQYSIHYRGICLTFIMCKHHRRGTLWCQTYLPMRTNRINLVLFYSANNPWIDYPLNYGKVCNFQIKRSEKNQEEVITINSTCGNLTNVWIDLWQCSNDPCNDSVILFKCLAFFVVFVLHGKPDTNIASLIYEILLRILISE